MTPRRSKLRLALTALAILLVLYGPIAYIALPYAWMHYEHKGLAGMPMVMCMAQNIPGDPIDVGLVGAKEDVLCAMHAAGWYPADPITFRSSVAIVGSVILRRPYRDAPVNNLVLRRPPRGPRLPEACRQKCGPASPRPFLGGAEAGARRGAQCGSAQ